jgi:hypothetical protein
LFADIVEKYHDNKDGHAPRVLVLAEHEIAYFKGKTVAEFNREFHLVDLMKIEYEPANEKINLYFKPSPGLTKQRPCRFSTAKHEEYVHKIANYLIRILPPYLAESSGAKALSNSGKGNVSISALKRLDAYSISRNIQIDPEVYKQVTDIVKYRQSKVVVPEQSGNDGARAVAAASLQNDPYVEELIFKPADGQGGFVSCARLPDGYSPFKHITFDQLYNKNLPQLLMTIVDRGQNFNTDGFSFINTAMTEENIGKIAGFFAKDEQTPAAEGQEAEKKKVINKKFESWCFDNAVLPEAFGAFNEKLLTPYLLEDVKVLGINHLNTVDVESVLAKTPNAVALSFAYDDLEIGETLRTISKQNIPSLKAISLAGNKCNQPTSTNEIRVPAGVELIDISDCTFADGQLVSFLRFILREKYTNGISINASNIHCSNEELVRGIEYIASVRSSPLVGLSWSNNKLPTQFCEILKKAKNLKALYINNCLTAEDKGVITALAECLKECKGLKKLMIKGGEKKIGTEIVPILKAIKRIEGFEWLDVSEQGIGAEGLLAISEIVDATKPKFIDFDGSAPPSPDPIQSILNVAQKNGTPIVISYPVKDATALAMDEGKLISDLAIFSQEPREEYDEADPFTCPFDTYVHQCSLEEEFPTFMSKKFVKDLEESTELVYQQEELKSPKRDTFQEEEESVEDDRERAIKQSERRQFYLEVSDVTTNASDVTNEEEKKELKPMITEDGFVEPNWEDFPENVLVTFDNTTAVAKNEKKYSLSVLREAIQ